MPKQTDKEVYDTKCWICHRGTIGQTCATIHTGCFGLMHRNSECPDKKDEGGNVTREEVQEMIEVAMSEHLNGNYHQD